MRPIACAPASTPADKRAVLHIAHTANDVQEPWSWYAAKRLSDPMRARATWWLLTEGGAPIASLLAYPLVLTDRTTTRPAVGFGSVATLPPHRGRGHATTLMRHVLEAGPDDALLFSAIGPSLYARLDFAEVPAHGWHHARPLDLISDSDAAALRPLDPWAELERLEEAYLTHTRGLHLARDRAAWEATLRENPTDRWFAVEGGGTLRIGEEPDRLTVLEASVPEDRFDSVVQAAAGIAAALDRQLDGWFAPTPWVEAHFTAQSRRRTQPMVRGAWDATASAAATLHPSDYF